MTSRTNKTNQHNKSNLKRSGSLNKYFFGTGEEGEEKKEENHQFDENRVDSNDIEEYVSINIEETELLYHFLDASNNDVSYLENSNYIRDEMIFLNSFSKFSETINDAFIGKRAYNSITLDLIALYLKGQKILYVESKTYCEQCLYFIMLPTIFISSACTVLSITLGFYEYGSTIVSALTTSSLGEPGLQQLQRRCLRSQRPQPHSDARHLLVRSGTALDRWHLLRIRPTRGAQQLPCVQRHGLDSFGKQQHLQPGHRQFQRHRSALVFGLHQRCFELGC